MTQFQNLKDFIDITQNTSQEQLSEAKASPIEGLSEIVKDALGDLSDKLGKNGALVEVMRLTGVDKLDNVKDKDGKLILQSIVSKTTDFVRDIKKLMLEVEVMMAQMDK